MLRYKTKTRPGLVKYGDVWGTLVRDGFWVERVKGQGHIPRKYSHNVLHYFIEIHQMSRPFSPCSAILIRMALSTYLLKTGVGGLGYQAITATLRSGSAIGR